MSETSSQISHNLEAAIYISPWWRHQMETFSALLAICAGNSPVPSEFPAQRPVTPSFDVFFDLRLNKRLNKQSSGWWFETISHPLWRHCRDVRSFCNLTGVSTAVLRDARARHTQLQGFTAWWLDVLPHNKLIYRASNFSWKMSGCARWRIMTLYKVVYIVICTESLFGPFTERTNFFTLGIEFDLFS